MLRQTPDKPNGSSSQNKPQVSRVYAIMDPNLADVTAGLLMSTSPASGIRLSPLIGCIDDTGVFAYCCRSPTPSKKRRTACKSFSS